LVCGLREEGDVSEGVTHGILHDECEALQNEAVDKELGSPSKLFIKRNFPQILDFNGRREPQQIAAIWGACMANPDYMLFVHLSLVRFFTREARQSFLNRLAALTGELLHFPRQQEFFELVDKARNATQAR
jgi:hypothetical protein